jgi:hypothetical protein
VGPIAALDTVVKGRIPSLFHDLNLPIIQPISQRYTTGLTCLLSLYIYIVIAHIRIIIFLGCGLWEISLLSEYHK